MGIGMLLWSMMAFSLPMHQQNIAFNVQKQIMAKHSLVGTASYYHPRFVGRPTATGETFSNNNFTAASNHFKLNTYAKITNLENGRVIYVKINDRMGQPHRIIDLTHRAAKALGYVYQGLTKVKIEPVPKREGKHKVMAQLKNKLAAKWKTKI